MLGNFVQIEPGKLAVDVNSLAGQKADLLAVSSGALIDGLVVPTATALLPGALTVVTASDLSSAAAVQPTLLFNWNLTVTNTSLSLVPSANFTPQGLSLTSSQSSLANYLTNAWNNSDRLFATLFGGFSQMASGSSYTAILDTLSPKATMAQATALAQSEGSILGAAMSCPVFVQQGTVLGEDSCAWAKFTGGWTNQYSTSDTLGYRVADTTYRLGAQHEVATDWYFGGSFGAGLTWATMNGGSSGSGQTFDGSLALKHTMGPWLLAGSLAVASGSYHNNRLLSLPGASAVLQSDSNMLLVGGRLRGAYDFAFDQWYVRPYGDLDIVYTHTPGFQESGSSVYALNVNSSNKTNVVLSPMVEFGGRFNVNPTTILRPYAAAGMTFLPNNTRTVSASIDGALPGDGTFQSFIKSPSVLGNFEFGVQLYQVGGFEVKAEYNLKAGNAFLAQSGTARVAYHF